MKCLKKPGLFNKKQSESGLLFSLRFLKCRSEKHPDNTGFLCLFEKNVVFHRDFFNNFIF
jgi:hypothetical protein